MRARRATAIWALLAFLLGVAFGPVLGWERKTVVVNAVTSSLVRSRGTVEDGWTVVRSDVVASDVRLVTFERPRVIGLTKLAGDAFNHTVGWLAWATSTGAYAERR
jgi:hypothetical protein